MSKYEHRKLFKYCFIKIIEIILKWIFLIIYRILRNIFGRLNTFKCLMSSETLKPYSRTPKSLLQSEAPQLFEFGAGCMWAIGFVVKINFESTHQTRRCAIGGNKAFGRPFGFALRLSTTQRYSDRLHGMIDVTESQLVREAHECCTAALGLRGVSYQFLFGPFAR